MSNTMRVTILGIKRGEMEGRKYAMLYTTTPTDSNNRDQLGVIPVSMSCDYDLLDAMERKQLPGDYDVMVNLKPGAGGKISMHATSCKFAGPAVNKPVI